jgi:hypothetical protein
MRHEQSVQSQEQATRATIDSFNEVFNRHDADGLAAFLTEDTVFEDTSPAPDASTERPPWSNSGANGSSAIPTHGSRLKRSSSAEVELQCYGSIARCATVSHGTCAALTSLRYEMEK